jgi:hypothetical protein
MIIKSDGNITWLATGIFESSCSIDVHYFPFDTQVKNLKLNNGKINV